LIDSLEQRLERLLVQLCAPAGLLGRQIGAAQQREQERED
jgi:hypothetical protein